MRTVGDGGGGDASVADAIKRHRRCQRIPVCDIRDRLQEARHPVLTTHAWSSPPRHYAPAFTPGHSRLGPTKSHGCMKRDGSQSPWRWDRRHRCSRDEPAKPSGVSPSADPRAAIWPARKSRRGIASIGQRERGCCKLAWTLEWRRRLSHERRSWAGTSLMEMSSITIPRSARSLAHPGLVSPVHRVLTGPRLEQPWTAAVFAAFSRGWKPTSVSLPSV